MTGDIYYHLNNEHYKVLTSNDAMLFTGILVKNIWIYINANWFFIQVLHEKI